MYITAPIRLSTYDALNLNMILRSSMVDSMLAVSVSSRHKTQLRYGTAIAYLNADCVAMIKEHYKRFGLPSYCLLFHGLNRFQKSVLFKQAILKVTGFKLQDIRNVQKAYETVFASQSGAASKHISALLLHSESVAKRFYRKSGFIQERLKGTALVNVFMTATSATITQVDMKPYYDEVVAAHGKTSGSHLAKRIFSKMVGSKVLYEKLRSKTLDVIIREIRALCDALL
jgi:hypothetical protein